MFVLLNFCPKILNNENAKMREIVDKHFPDNWIIPVFQGYLIDLTVYWNEFKAAKMAMNNNIVVDNIKKIARTYYKKMTNSKT
jgi:WASH complex subunit strumpellin